MKGDFETALEFIAAEHKRKAALFFDEYVAQLFHSAPHLRIKAAETLGDSENPNAVKHLIECIHTDLDSDVIYVAIKALGKLKDKSTVSHILPFLSSDDKWLRRTAAEAIGAIADKETLNDLILMLKSPYDTERAGAVEAIGHMSYWEMADYVIPLLSDKSDIVRTAAVSAIRRLGRSDLV